MAEYNPGPDEEGGHKSTSTRPVGERMGLGHAQAPEKPVAARKLVPTTEKYPETSAAAQESKTTLPTPEREGDVDRLSARSPEHRPSEGTTGSARGGGYGGAEGSDTATGEGSAASPASATPARRPTWAEIAARPPPPKLEPAIAPLPPASSGGGWDTFEPTEATQSTEADPWGVSDNQSNDSPW